MEILAVIISSVDFISRSFYCMVKYAIITDKLTKKFGDFVADNDISLKVKEGEIFGILGPNGAGKTTLISMLTTLIRPTSGHATVLGKDIIKQQLEVRKSIGVITEKVTMYPPLTAEKTCSFSEGFTA
jgi:ABC-type multidrug transport system, ATPase component